ncbi:MAG: tetratricopeptide repeat protein [Candidatus Omnitrophota bacterium]
MKYIIIIAVLSMVVYANSIGGAFVSDDIVSIQKNEAIGDASTWTKLSDPIHFLIYRNAGLDARAYHIFNIIAHSAACVLVFFFLLNFFKTVSAFFAALLFAVHPIHTEAVSWISGSDYLLITILLISSFLLYKRVTSLDNKKCLYFFAGYAGSLFLYATALFTKWDAVLYPLMLIGYDVVFNKWRKNFKLWSAYILLAAWFVLTNIHMLKYRIVSVASDMKINNGLTNPLFNMAYSLFSHTKLLLWPVKLTFYHEPYVVSQTMLIFQIFLLILFLALWLFLFKKAKPAFFAIGIYILFLGATYSPVPISWLVAERYLYLPSLGFVMLVAFLLEKTIFVSPRRCSKGLPRGGESNGRVQEIVIIFLVIIIGTYSIRTIFRNEDWKSRASLWRATVESSPLSPRAHNNMGDIYSLDGDLAAAANEFKKAIELKPDYADAYFNLGLTYDKMGEKQKAISYINKAIELKPELAKYIRKDL